MKIIQPFLYRIHFNIEFTNLRSTSCYTQRTIKTNQADVFLRALFKISVRMQKLRSQHRIKPSIR